jgi:hypothetical protein
MHAMFMAHVIHHHTFQRHALVLAKEEGSGL